MRIINDPFEEVLQAVRELYGETDVEIQFHPGLGENGEGPFGETIFPDDGGTPLVNISMNINILDALEVLGHELAHVVAGLAEEHSPQWKLVFKKIHKKFDEIQERKKEKHNENKRGK